MITLDTLRAVPLLASMADSELREVAAAAADVHLAGGEWLVREGEAAAFFLILSGGLEVVKTVAGTPQVITCYHAGDHAGEVPLLLGSPFIAGLRALGDIRIMRLDTVSFHTLILRSEKLAASILRTMIERVSRLQHVVAEAPVDETVIVGYPSDPACYDLRQFLSGNRIDFRWLNPAASEQSTSEESAMGPKMPPGIETGPYPVVVLRDGSLLRVPSKREVADRLNLQTSPRQASYDTVIIGGGPAGLAAAVYGASEGLRTLLVERQAPGGQAGTSSRIENYLGFPAGLSGSELAARALQQARRFGTEVVVTRTAVALNPAPSSSQSDSSSQIVLDGKDVVEARTVILATGVAWRSLSIPGAEALMGRGVYYGAARTEALGVQGKEVYLIGGGNSAGQAAMFFADYARQVTLLIRAASIEAGMSQYLISQLAAKGNVSVELDTAVVSVHGEDQLEAITVRQGPAWAGAVTNCYQTESLFVFIGADAETDWLPDAIACDERGYLLTGLDAQTSGKWSGSRDPYLLETSIPGVFAAGDVRHGSIKRVSSGVGEGSMAIAFVHQYLALSQA